MAEVDAAARQAFWRQASPETIQLEAERMFGDANPRLSTRSELRFGSRGSVAVELTGERAGKWFDHERGEGGLLPVPDDAFRQLAGASSGHRIARPAPRPPAPDQKPSPADQEREVTAILAAQRIWKGTLPLAGTLADHYLRRIRRRDPTGCEDLRFHPSLDFEGEKLPALVAAMRDVRSGQLVAVHRTFLNARTGEKVARKMRGRAREAAVMLDPFVAPTYGLGICEGVEDGLAARRVFRPLWALASAGAMAKFAVLPGLDALTIFSDADPAGQRAAVECSDRWAASGAEVVTVKPYQFKDIDEAMR